MQFEQIFFLFIGPGLLIDTGTEVIIPSFSALFASSFIDSKVVFEFGCYFGPIIDPKFLYKFDNGLILLNGTKVTSLLQDCLLIIY